MQAKKLIVKNMQKFEASFQTFSTLKLQFDLELQRNVFDDAWSDPDDTIRAIAGIAQYPPFGG